LTVPQIKTKFNTIRRTSYSNLSFINQNNITGQRQVGGCCCRLSSKRKNLQRTHRTNPRFYR